MTICGGQNTISNANIRFYNTKPYLCYVEL